MAPTPARAAGPFALLTLLVAAAACGDTAGPDLQASARPSRPPPPAVFRCDADDGGLTLPAGFCATVFADGVGGARHLTVSPNGDLYVAVAASGGGTGRVVALRDGDRDGHADQTASFGAPGGNGIAWFEQRLYVAENDRVVRYSFKKAGNLAPTGSAAVVVSGLPADRDHRNKSIAIDANGALYVNIGSATNACQVANRQLESPGIDPCPELGVRAGIWRFDARATGQVQTAAATQRHATGLRNVVALAVEPATRTLFGVQMNRDNFYDAWPRLYTPEEDAQAPSEELVRITAGADFGWPYCYHDAAQGRKLLAPEYGGDKVSVGRCAAAAPPSLAFPAHWAPLSMAFYGGVQFPAGYRGGAFVAFHGDFFTGRGRANPSPGYLVAFVPFTAGQPAGGYTVFATGFVGGGTATPTGAAHRPSGVAVAPDGALFIADDKGGRIWRVVYQGS